MRIFSKYKNLSNEKFLIQQFNALNQEMDLLQSHLGKVNQLLNDTIAEKCKHELMHEQQQHLQQRNQNNNNNLTVNSTPAPTTTSTNQNGQSSVNNQQTPEIIDHKASLFRASLVPVGNIPTGTPTSQASVVSDSPSTATTTAVTNNHNSSSSSSSASTSSSSSSSAASSHLLHNQMKTLVLSSQQFGSSDNLLTGSNVNHHPHHQPHHYNPHYQYNQKNAYTAGPIISNSGGQHVSRASNPPQLQHNLSYLIANNNQPNVVMVNGGGGGSGAGNGRLLNNEMCKSIDSIYTPTTTISSNNSNKTPINTGGAFNSVTRRTNPKQQQSSSQYRPTYESTELSSDEMMGRSNMMEANNGHHTDETGESSPSPQTMTTTANSTNTATPGGLGLGGKEIQISFQPVNFTNYRPKPMSLYQQQNNNINGSGGGGNSNNYAPATSNSGFKPTNFKRDLIAEKKRSSIGKSPHNYYVNMFILL